MKLFAKKETTSYRSGMQSFANAKPYEAQKDWVRIGDAGYSVLQNIADAMASNTRQSERGNL